MLAIVIAVTVGIPLLLAVTTGSISIPHNDAWSYSKIAQVFATSGKIDLTGWNRGALIGQFVMLGPLARWIPAQQVAVAALAALSLCLSYTILARRVTPRSALLGTALVGVFPAFGLLATSFMEDIPAFAAVVGCLAIADLARERGSRRLLVLALAVGLFGVTIREQVVAAPVAVLIAAYFAGSRRERRAVSVMAVVFCALFALFEYWRHHLPYPDSPSGLHFHAHIAFQEILQGYFLLSLALSPAIFLAGRPQRRLIVGYALGGLVGVVGIAEAVHLHGGMLLGNYLSATGAYSAADIGRQTVFPPLVMGVLVAIALVAGIMLPAVVVSNWADLDPALLAFTVLTLLGTVVEVVAGQLIFDRYFLVLLLPGTVLCLRSRQRLRSVVPAGTALVVLAVLSLSITANGLSRDAAQWHEADHLVSSGIPATSVNAGLDWSGFHSTRPLPSSTPSEASKVAFWAPLFPESRACFLVAAGPLADHRSEGHVPYRTFALFGTSSLDLYKVGTCPKGAAN